uniref:Isomerase YbhE n=1 Tax=Rhabditophanes sp. KR3021 TaxID=114890 RepID=A0AC35TLS7_9BILA
MTTSALINIGQLPWTDNDDRITSIVCNEKLYVFERKYKKDGERVHNFAVFHTGNNFAIYDLTTHKLLKHAVHKELEVGGDKDELFFVKNNELYLLTFSPTNQIELDAIFKFDVEQNEFRHLLKISGDTTFSAEYENQFCRLLSCGEDDKHNVYFLSDADQANGLVISLNMDEGKASRIIFESSADTHIRCVMSKGVYHDNMIDVFYGHYGCGVMPCHRNVWRFDLKSRKHSILNVTVADNYNLGMTSIAFVKYVPQKDGIVVGRNYMNCGFAGRGGGIPQFDGNLWLMHNVSTSHLSWTRIKSKVDGNSEKENNGVAFINFDPETGVVVYGKKKDGIFMESISFEAGEPDIFENDE